MFLLFKPRFSKRGRIDILELQIKSKKKVLGVYFSNFETYTKYPILGVKG